MINWIKREYRHSWNYGYLGLSERELTIFHFYQSLSLYLNEFNHWVWALFIDQNFALRSSMTSAHKTTYYDIFLHIIITLLHQLTHINHAYIYIIILMSSTHYIANLRHLASDWCQLKSLRWIMEWIHHDETLRLTRGYNKELLSADLNSYAEKGKILPVGHVYWTFFQWGILGLYQVRNTWLIQKW